VASDQSYDLDPSFERQLVVVIATRPKSMGRVGVHLDPDGLRGATCKLVLKAAQAIFRDAGAGPSAPQTVMQRLRRWMGEGTVTLEEIGQAMDLFVEVPRPLPTDDEVLAEVGPLLQRKMQYEAVNIALDDLANRRNFDRVQTMLSKAARVGAQDVSLGGRVGSDSLDRIAAAASSSRCAFGVRDLDVQLGGGLRVGCAMAFCGGPKSGKCHRKGQGILMHSGEIRKVEDIKVGDVLCGPHGPRRVLRTNTGRGQMYEVRPNKGPRWCVNADHILTVYWKHHGREHIEDVSVREWLAWPKTRRRYSKLVRAPASFSRGPRLPMSPYLLGLILGDGSTLSGSVSVTTADPEIVRELRKGARAFGLRVVCFAERGAAKSYRLSGRPRAKGQGWGTQINPLLKILRQLGVFRVRADKKHVPSIYKTADRASRLEMLAALIDTDGHHGAHGSFDFVSASRQLAEDVVFIARSVGLRAQMKPCKKRCQTGVVGTYFRVGIHGHTAMVPVRVARKKPPIKYGRSRDAMHTGFTVKPTGTREKYYGFTLDGDGRYLLDDFTVTHNSFALCHTAAWNVVEGRFVGYVSLELSQEQVEARVIANITHVATEDLEQDELARHLARMRLRKLEGHVGACWVKRFPAKATTMLDVRAWVKDCEAAAGRKMDLVVLDYADKLRSHDKNDKDLYRGMGTVYEDFRLLCADENKWGVTASQSTRAAAKEGAKGRRVEATDVADSIEKLRVLDLLVTISYDEDAETVSFHVGSDAVRHGRGGFETAPQPHDRPHGRVIRMEKFYGVAERLLVPKPKLVVIPGGKR